MGLVLVRWLRTLSKRKYADTGVQYIDQFHRELSPRQRKQNTNSPCFNISLLPTNFLFIPYVP